MAPEYQETREKIDHQHLRDVSAARQNQSRSVPPPFWVFRLGDGKAEPSHPRILARRGCVLPQRVRVNHMNFFCSVSPQRREIGRTALSVVEAGCAACQLRELGGASGPRSSYVCAPYSGCRHNPPAGLYCYPKWGRWPIRRPSINNTGGEQRHGFQGSACAGRRHRRLGGAS